MRILIQTNSNTHLNAQIASNQNSQNKELYNTKYHKIKGLTWNQ